MIPVSADQDRRQRSKKPEPVMVGVDGSWQQTGAVQWALDQALRTDAPLHMLHVVDTGYGANWPIAAMPNTLRTSPCVSPASSPSATTCATTSTTSRSPASECPNVGRRARHTNVLD
jgi:hypothetical protein